MRAKDIIGKTVKAVHQKKEFNIQIGQMNNYIDHIEFTDGTLLVLNVHEWENGYTVDGGVIKNNKLKSRRPE